MTTKNSLYIGDLDPNVTEAVLKKFLIDNSFTPSSIKLNQKQNNQGLISAHVTFITNEDAQKAMEKLSFQKLLDSYIRVNWELQKAVLRNPNSNLFVKGLPADVEPNWLYDHFSDYGTIISAKVVYSRDTGKCKGYGFVNFEDEKIATKILEKGFSVGDLKLTIKPFKSKSEREDMFTNLYIKGFDENVTNEMLKEKFSPFGEITSPFVMRDENGVSKKFGFVNFASHESAVKAIEELHDTKWNDSVLYVVKALTKEERKKEQEIKKAEKKKEMEKKFQGTNLYIRNLPPSYTKEDLDRDFGDFGTIRSSTIVMDDNGVSKEFGFVAFNTRDEANKATKELTGRMLKDGKKPIEIFLALKKDEKERVFKAFKPSMTMQSPYGYQQIPMHAMNPMFRSLQLQSYQMPSYGYPKGFMPNMNMNVQSMQYPRIQNDLRKKPQKTVATTKPTVPAPISETPAAQPNTPLTELETQTIGEEIYSFIEKMNADLDAGRLTGIIIASLPPSELRECVLNQEMLTKRIEEANKLLASQPSEGEQTN